VAALLILLGTMVIWRYVRGRWHMHAHAHTAAAPHFTCTAHAADRATGTHNATVRCAGDRSASGPPMDSAAAAPLPRCWFAAVPDTMSRLVYFAAFSAGHDRRMLGVSLTLSVLVRFAAERGTRWATILHVERRWERTGRDSSGVGCIVQLVLIASPSATLLFSPYSRSDHDERHHRRAERVTAAHTTPVLRRSRTLRST